MVESVILQIIMTLLFSMGMSVTADNIGDTLQGAYSSQPPEVRQQIDIIIDNPRFGIPFYTFMGGVAVTQDIVDFFATSDGTVSASDLSAIVGDVPHFLQANQGNITTKVDRHPNYTYTYTASDGSSVKVEYRISGNTMSFFAIAYDSSGVFLYENWLCDCNADFAGEILVNSEFSDSYPFTVRIPNYGWWGGISSTTRIDLVDRFPFLDSNTVKSDNYVESEVAAPVGTAFVDGQEVALNPDGSITLSDGTTIPMNPDGTITLPNDVIVSPRIDLGVYNDAAIQSLLQAILAKLAELEHQLEFDTDTTLDLTVEVAYDGVLSEFMLNSSIMQVFPFCLPADFYRGIKLFSADPVTPRFTYTIDIPSIGMYEGDQVVIDIDLSYFEELAFITRWVSTVGFSLTLVFISTKIVKGAGA